MQGSVFQPVLKCFGHLPVNCRVLLPGSQAIFQDLLPHRNTLLVDVAEVDAKEDVPQELARVEFTLCTKDSNFPANGSEPSQLGTERIHMLHVENPTVLNL